MHQNIKNKIKFVSVTLIFTIIINISSLGLAHAAISASSLLSLTNSARSAEGLSSLTTNSQLQSAAQSKAENMFQDQYFSHESPDGRNPWDFIKSAGYDYVYAGENLGIGYDSTSELQNAWLNSPSHRANIMSPNFREIGFAAVSGTYEGAETIIVVEMFGSTEASQPTTEGAVESANISSTEENTDNSAESAPTEATPTETTTEDVQKSNYTVNTEKTSFSPDKVYVGDEVTFKTTITGDFNDAYFMVGDQKVSLKESLEGQMTNPEKNLEKKEIVNIKGDLVVKLYVIDKTGEHVQEIGKLVVNEKVISKDVKNDSFMAKVKSAVSDNAIILIIMLIILTFGFVGILFYRYQKTGKFA